VRLVASEDTVPVKYEILTAGTNMEEMLELHVKIQITKEIGLKPVIQAGGAQTHRLPGTCRGYCAGGQMAELGTRFHPEKENPGAQATGGPFEVLPKALEGMGLGTQTLGADWPQGQIDLRVRTDLRGAN
jgi:hypothetical protein